MRVGSRENTLKQEAHAKSDKDEDDASKQERALFLRHAFKNISLPYSEKNKVSKQRLNFHSMCFLSTLK